MTPKQIVKAAEPNASLDYYENLRAAGQPCWYIRLGLQGRSLSDICSSPRAAWKNSAESLAESLRAEKKAGR